MGVRLFAAGRSYLSGIWTYSAKRWDETQADGYVRLFADRFDDLARGVLKGCKADDIRSGDSKLAVGTYLSLLPDGCKKHHQGRVHPASAHGF